MKVTHHSATNMDSPPLSPRNMSPIKFKTSSQRGTFHGTYNKNAARDQKVKDLLLEIEREAKVKLMREQAREGSKQDQARKMGKAKKIKRKREKYIEARDKEMSWTGNFGFGARLPEYSSENDRYCPLGLARRFNRTTSTIDDAGREASPTKLTRTVTLRGTLGGNKVRAMIAEPPKIMSSATMALSGVMTDAVKNNKIEFSKTEPLPPIPTSPTSPTYPTSPTTKSPSASPTSSSPAPISFQSIHEDADSLEIVKYILTRSKLVMALKSVMEDSESELEVLRASGHEDKAKFPKDRFISVTNDLRVCTIKIVEMIVRWGEKQPNETTYTFRNSDYLLTLFSDLDFVSTNARACKAFDYGPKVPASFFNCNPFLSPVPLRRTVVEDETDEAKANPKVTWSTEDDFHACPTRVLGVGTDILQIRDVSAFIISKVRETVNKEEEAKRMELSREESDEAEGEGDEHASPTSPMTAKSKLPFFTLCEFKYSTYLPNRNVLGSIDGLNDMELEQGTLRHGTADIFDNKTNRWQAKQSVPLSSERRGTFFGTVPLKIAAKPELQLRRIVETVPMLTFREKGTKAKVELEELINYGKSEEKNIALLKDELAKIREKVHKAKNIYENILNSGRTEKARKFKVKWSFWYEEQEALAKEIKRRAAELFFKKDHLHRLVRIIDKMGEQYEIERGKAIADLKRKAAALENKKQRVVVIMQRWAKGIICRNKIWPILMEKIMAATRIANLQRVKEARKRVQARRQEHREQMEASIMMQGIIRKKQAKGKVNMVRLEKKQQNNSALMLQQKTREKIARKRVQSKRQERRESVALIKIQTKARKGLAAKEAERRRRKKLQNAALLVIQCWSRMLLAHKRVARRIAELQELERLAELQRQEEERKRVEAEKRAEEEKLEKERAEALRKIEEREKAELEERQKKDAEERERREREKAEEERLKVQKEREEWRKLKEAEAEEYRQLMLAASKEEVEKLAAEKAAKEVEDAKREAELLEAEDAVFGSDNEFDDDDVSLAAESLASIGGSLDEGTHFTEEEQLSLMYEWSSIANITPEGDSEPASAEVVLRQHRAREKAIIPKMIGAGIEHGDADAHYNALLDDTVDHYMKDHMMEIAVKVANEENMEFVLKSAKTQEGKKAEAFKILRHKGYQAKLQQSLVKRARDALKQQGRKKLVELRKEQKMEVKWLTHQVRRYEAFTWLRDLAEVEETKRQKDWGEVQEETFVELTQLVHRFMF